MYFGLFCKVCYILDVGDAVFVVKLALKTYVFNRFKIFHLVYLKSLSFKYYVTTFTVALNNFLATCYLLTVLQHVLAET